MQPDVMVIVQRLSRYLRSHPDACDTPDGIARWWMDDEGPLPVPAIETALVWMSECGLVESITAADGRVRFRRAGGDDLDARLDAMAADPQSVMPKKPPRGVH